MEKKLSIKQALGIGFSLAFRNIGAIFLLFFIPFMFFVVQIVFHSLLQNIAAQYSFDFWFRWLSNIVWTLVILPIFLGIYRTGKPTFHITLSKSLLVHVFTVTLINEIILANLNLFSLIRKIDFFGYSGLFVFLVIEILMTIVFIYLLYPYIYFATIFVIDQNMNIKEALSASSRIVNGHVLYLFLASILMALLFIVSIVTIVGPFFTAAAIQIAFIHFYHVLQNREHEMVHLS